MEHGNEKSCNLFLEKVVLKGEGHTLTIAGETGMKLHLPMESSIHSPDRDTELQNIVTLTKPRG